MPHRPLPPNRRTGRGRRAEALAARYLEAQGWEILGRNVRISRDEIDLIARDGEEIVFVEVRSRRRGSRYPTTDLGPGKRRRLIRGASAWLGRTGRGNCPCRFDLVTVRFGARSARLEHYPGAFVDDFED